MQNSRVRAKVVRKNNFLWQNYVSASSYTCRTVLLEKQRGKEIYKLPFGQREATNTFASNRRGKERSDRNVHPRIKSFSELVKIEFTTGQSYSLNFIARILVKLPDQQYLPFLVVHRNTHLGILTFALTTVYANISSSSVKLFDI